MALKMSLIKFPLLALMLLEPGWVHFSLGQETPVMRFYRQHIDPVTPASNNKTYCDVMMKKRNMTFSECKLVNTFVHTSRVLARAVCCEPITSCKNGTENCHKSRASMKLTKCVLKNGSRYPNCSYWTNPNMGHILVVCDEKMCVPVHFDGWL